MTDIQSLRDTIVPKSDQLNADDLIAGPITVTIQGVKRGSSPEQPVDLEIDGGRQPYKPCKSMRRVLIGAWGDDGRQWVGRSMTLFTDPEVKFGGVKVGGIRISHMSHIKGRLSMMLTTTRSKRSEYVVEPLVIAEFPLADWVAAIESSADMESLANVFKKAVAAAKKANADSTAIVAAKDKRKSELEGAA